MKNLDEYGKGRQSVILEMIEWCEKEITAIKEYGSSSDSIISSFMTGQMKAYIKVKQKLTVKNDRLKEVDMETQEESL
jgi:hypothetical protein